MTCNVLMGTLNPTHSLTYSAAMIQQAVCVGTRHAPAPLLPHGRPAPRAPRSRRNVAVVSHACITFSRSPLHLPALTPRWVNRPGDLDPESGVRVTCDVGYLCANFGLPRPLCFRLRPDVRDRQTDVRHHQCLMPRLLGAGAQ